MSLGFGVTPTLVAALLRETGDVAEPLAPGVVRVERQPFGKAALEGRLQAAVVRNAAAIDVADVRRGWEAARSADELRRPDW